MRTPAYNCACCGSANLRLSRRQSKLELLKTCLGTYPFRCLDCNHRFWVNIWLFSKLAYAKCPKCLGRELTAWPSRAHHLSTWKKLLMTFGANRYRCLGCRYRFLSFRPSEEAMKAAAGVAEQADLPETVDLPHETTEPGTLAGEAHVPETETKA